jgi:hypothetical protein
MLIPSSKLGVRRVGTKQQEYSSHFTEVPDAAETTDEPVERQELEDVMDTGQSDEPFKERTEAG